MLWEEVRIIVAQSESPCKLTITIYYLVVLNVHIITLVCTKKTEDTSIKLFSIFSSKIQCTCTCSILKYNLYTHLWYCMEIQLTIHCISPFAISAPYKLISAAGLRHTSDLSMELDSKFNLLCRISVCHLSSVGFLSPLLIAL